MEIDYGDGSDRTWRAAFREGYRRSPRKGELRNYKFWHWVSRQRGFSESGAWEAWPSKPIPPDVVFPREPVAEPPSDIEAPPSVEPEPELAAHGDKSVAQIKATAFEREKDTAANGTRPRRSPRSIEPRALKRDSKLLAQLNASAAVEDARRLLMRRLAGALWPRSAVLTEARLAGIPVEAIDLAAGQLGVRTIDGRWRLPGA